MLKKLKIVLVLASLSVTLCLMSNTYSRYVADTTNNVEALFAKWEILVNDTDITNGTSSEVEFEPVIEPNTNIASNVIAPSSKGYFDIEIDPTNVDVSFEYSIDLNVINQNIPDLMITKYSIIPDDYQEGNTLRQRDLNGNKITGSLNYDNTTENPGFDVFTIRVYFEWYDGKDEAMNDAADTSIATSDQITTLQMGATITFKQIL